MPSDVEGLARAGHVRNYPKRDLIERVEAISFTVKLIGMVHFSPECFRSCGITELSILYVVEKQADGKI